MRARAVLPIVSLAAALISWDATWADGSESKPAAEEKTPGVADYNEGVGLMKKEKFAEAQAKFEAAIAANDSLAVAHNNLAYSLRKQGREHYAAALAHYDRAIALDPKLKEAYMYRGVLHMLLGDEAKALADHKALVELDRKLAEELKAAIASGEEPKGLEGLAKKW